MTRLRDRPGRPLDELPAGVRSFLETGALPARGVPGRARAFWLMAPHARSELRRLWLAVRTDLLAEWKRAHKDGQPWAEEAFGNRDAGRGVYDDTNH